MKTFLRTFLIVLTIICTEKVCAQEGAIGILYFTPSQKLIVLGMSGTSLPNDDPAGFYYNPAQLGYISQTNDISLQAYTSDVDWLGKFLPNAIKYKSTSFNIGYNFNLLG
jgi:hypothetical protein